MTQTKHRTARSDFVIALETNRAIQQAKFAEAFLSEWCRHPRPELRPERWGEHLPARRLVTSAELEQLVSEWQRVPLTFTRVSSPRQSVSIRWRKSPALSERPFPHGLTAWLAKSGGADAARDFLMLVVKHFDPAFVALTTREEYRRKHCFKVSRNSGDSGSDLSERFCGHYVSETVPGIYWITYLGAPIVERVGEPRLRSIPLGRLEPFGKGYFLIAYDNSALIGSNDAQRREAAIIRYLGERLFFQAGNKPIQRARYGSRTQRYADENRQRPTNAEMRFNQFLRRLDGGKYCNQFTFQWAFDGKWILDVYFRELQLGFEVDGSYHDDADRRKLDRMKAQDCARRGITLIRLTNEEVLSGDDETLGAKVRKGINEALFRQRLNCKLKRD